jgi:hypothetical protein
VHVEFDNIARLTPQTDSRDDLTHKFSKTDSYDDLNTDTTLYNSLVIDTMMDMDIPFIHFMVSFLLITSPIDRWIHFTNSHHVHTS